MTISEPLEDLIEKLQYCNQMLVEIREMPMCDCKIKKLGIVQNSREEFLVKILNIVNDEYFYRIDFKDL